MSLAKGGWRALDMMHSHVVSAVTYSARVNGMCDDIFDALRTVVRTATSTVAAGGSATVDLMLQKNKYERARERRGGHHMNIYYMPRSHACIAASVTLLSLLP